MYIPDYNLEQDTTVNLNFRVHPKMKEDVMAAATDNNLSMAQWCRKALLFALQNMDTDLENELDTKIKQIFEEMFEQKMNKGYILSSKKEDYKKEDETQCQEKN